MTITGGDIKLSMASAEFINDVIADVVIVGNDVQRDPGLETLLTIVIFTDARADDNDILPFKNDDRGGFWGDTINGFSMGSKLWLLRRSVLNQKTLNLAQEYIYDAIKTQVIDENICKDAIVETSKSGNRMNIIVEIVGFDNQTVFYEWYTNWTAQLGRA